MFGIFSNKDKRMCRNKVRYQTYIAAQEALKRINPANAKAGRPTRYYKCPLCAGYHLTRSKQQ